jgi:hypothetical protein
MRVYSGRDLYQRRLNGPCHPLGFCRAVSFVAPASPALFHQRRILKKSKNGPCHSLYVTVWRELPANERYLETGKAQLLGCHIPCVDSLVVYSSRKSPFSFRFFSFVINVQHSVRVEAVSSRCVVGPRCSSLSLLAILRLLLFASLEYHLLNVVFLLCFFSVPQQAPQGSC